MNDERSSLKKYGARLHASPAMPRLTEYQQSAIDALNEMTADEVKELMTSTIYVTPDFMETLQERMPNLAAQCVILGGGTSTGTTMAFDFGVEFNRAAQNQTRRYMTIIDEAIKDAAKIDAAKSNDIRREAKRLRQAEAKLARARQIRANGGRR